jgi:alpha-L-arabinofuranosidase
MKFASLSFFAAIGVALLSQGALADDVGTLDIDLSHPGHLISPIFYGLMTEEVNHSYDGGLFPELIQNRTFQDPTPDGALLPNHWSIVGSAKATIDHENPVNPALPVSFRLDLTGETCGIANDGFWGVPIWPNTTYTASFYAKGTNGFSGPITASLVTDEASATEAKASSAAVTSAWQKYTVSLKTDPGAPTTAHAKFALSVTGKGRVSFSLVSLFPPTYQNIPGGLRPDLMKLMVDMHPAFIRLPGGNYLEGDKLANHYDWKKMIGPADLRPGHMGCWSYRSSDGFGLPQELLWCKQLGAEPVLAVFAGYALNGEHVDAGSPELARYVKEALEEIEYVSGSPDSEWGKRRVADGFSDPFPLHYVEIGNEDFFDRSGSYDGRFEEFASAIRAKHPQLKLIATTRLKSAKPDLYDDHFYARPAQMMKMDAQYDPPPGGLGGRRGDGTHVFVGEWASQEGGPTPDLSAALGDAVFLMALERNSDVVNMESYAPLLTNVNRANPRGWQWPVNLIGYDALHSFGSPSYYVQAMFGQNKGEFTVPATLKVPPLPVAPEPGPHGSIGLGTWGTRVEYKDIEVTAPDGGHLSQPSLGSDSKLWRFNGGDWSFDGGVISPRGKDPHFWSLAGDSAWTDYTIRLKARKVGGSEGFLVLWHAVDGNTYHWWNIGGWGNSGTRAEAAVNGDRGPYGPLSPFKVDTDRWYNLRIEVKGHHMQGYVDDQLITDAVDLPPPPLPLNYASASYSSHGQSVIVKVVNARDNPQSITINIRGASRIDPSGTAIVLTGEPKAVNTLDQPLNVAPIREALENLSMSFTRTFPRHSVTVLTLKATRRGL